MFKHKAQYMINQSYESAKSDPADLTIDAFSASSGREKEVYSPCLYWNQCF